MIPSNRVLLAPGQPVRTLYFLADGLCSIRHVMRSGRTVEIAMVGSEGIIGIDAMFGIRRVQYVAIMRISDARALAMDVQVFQDEMQSAGSFARIIERYAHTFLNSVNQSAACHAVHSVDERCARWLLTIRHRTGRNEFPFTQASMAEALGVRRPTVTLAVAALRRMGLIDYERRRLRILSPAGLSAVACECRPEASRRRIR